MPSRLPQAIGAVKDRASIRLAKLARSSDIDIAILKATTHEEAPANDRRLTKIFLLLLCASFTSPTEASATFVRALSRRISRTRNWVVALKSLLVVFRILRDGNSHIDHKALLALPPPSSAGGLRRRLLDLSNFRDESSRTRSWDFTAFVRTFALYLEARQDAALAGKIENLRCQPSVTRRGLASAEPSWVLDRVVHWQRLLDRAIATQPTGMAKSHRLVQVAFYNVVRETFSLYHNIFDGLSIILNDELLRLQRGLCEEAFHACTKARSQFEELESFYKLCNQIGVGRTSEYPDVQKIPETMIRTLEELSKQLPCHESSDVVNSPPSLQNDRKPEIVISSMSTANYYSLTDHTQYSNLSSNYEKMIKRSKGNLFEDAWYELEEKELSNDKHVQAWELGLVESTK